MTQVQDIIDRRAKRRRYLGWGLGLAGMVCCSILIGTGGYCLGTLVYISAGGVIGDSKLAQSYMDQGLAIWMATPVLALAPWVIGGIVLGARWRRSRRSAAPEANE